MKVTFYTDLKKQKEVLAKIKKEFPDAYIIFDSGDKPKSADEMFEELGYKIEDVSKYRIFRAGSWEAEFIVSHNKNEKIRFGQHGDYVYATVDTVKALAKYIEEQEQNE